MQQPTPIDTIFQSYSRGLYKLTGSEQEDDILNMLNPDTNADNSASITVPADLIGSGVDTSTTISATGSMQAGKKTFDNTALGYILGVDPKDGYAKFFIGNTTSYINWDGTSLTVVGGVNISQLNIPDSTTASSFHVDTSGNAWWGTNVATGYASAPAKILATGAATFTNVSVTGTVNATGGYIGSTTALVYEAQGINTGVTGYIRGGQTDFNTGTGFFLGYSGAAYKFSIGNPSSDYLTWDGTTLATNKFVLSGIGAFGGDGSDGPLSVSSGTTTVDLGNAAYVVKNYTSISITGTGAVQFINPNANGTVIILKCRSFTLTSSAAPMLDASGCGAAGGAAVSSSGSGSSGNVGGNNGTAGTSYSLFFGNTNAGAAEPGAGTGGVGGALPTFAIQNATFSSAQIFNKYQNLWTAAGSASGSIGHATAAWTATTGAGGRGGGTLIVECAGAWNFTTASGISVAGINGTDASTTGGTVQAGGGAGGPGGYFLGLYNTLTANSGTVNVGGGIGGKTSKIGGIGTGAGGGSGSNAINAGSNGSIQLNGVKSGADGPAGASLITQNTYYA